MLVQIKTPNLHLQSQLKYLEVLAVKENRNEDFFR